ncbi:MAG: MaoC family dehydratase [Tissierellia bacterium]|nr:MaoC family dehydratase [Bacillota bacterium]NLL22248.1 MaoC family dehydratase [Tissierellia bacterium]
MKKKTIHELQVGDQASTKVIITEDLVKQFADVSGDKNPVHLDEEYASATPFKSRIAHGMLVGSLFSTLLGTELPGEGTIYLEQNLRFTKPVYLGDEITASVTVRELVTDKNRVLLDTVATNQRDEVVITGTAGVLAPR